MLISCLEKIISELRRENIVAIPTDTIYGLSCLPTERAIRKLLDLKDRPVKKGLILVAHRLDFLLDWVDVSQLTSAHLALLRLPQATPTTYVVPAKAQISELLTGGRATIAIRFTVKAPEIFEICEALHSPIVTSSANYSQAQTLFDSKEINACFSDRILVYNNVEACWMRERKSSRIIDLLSGQVLRA